MNIHEFISNYKNHPILFIGSGFSFRYLKDTYTWDKLLEKICTDLWGNDEKYLDIKAKYQLSNGAYSYPRIASEIEIEFNSDLEKNRNGQFKEINDAFYESMRKGITLSRFKIYISNILHDYVIKEDMNEELTAIKKIRKNIGSIITTNYDKFTEDIFEFNPLIGNDILLSNPYGSIYKIHGCVDDISKIIITEEDYKKFDEQYALIRAQMLSMFIHNPIIFIGYGIGDENIKKVLKTIFSYIPLNSLQAEKVRQNFLLVEYEKNSGNLNVTDHDIVIDGDNIRINKLKTDDFLTLYNELANINLPISAMDIRKVQNVVKEIYSGGNQSNGLIQVRITENLDELKNSDMILAIGSPKTIHYQFLTVKEMIQNYFNIIDESNVDVLETLNKQTISKTQYFPVYGFSTFCHKLEKVQELKEIQKNNVDTYIRDHCTKGSCENEHTSIQDICQDNQIAYSYKSQAIMYGVKKNNIPLEDLELYLRNVEKANRNTSDYKRLLCLYDMMKYK